MEGIAVGYQHSHMSMTQGFRAIYLDQGIRGLWRGVSGAAPRVTVGSAAQLSTFSLVKDYMLRNKVIKVRSLDNFGKQGGRHVCLWIRRSTVQSKAATSGAAVIVVSQTVAYKLMKFIFTVYNPIFWMRC